ncbi:hypothetical protein VTK26DRAFT_3110 [Humicola hyalothermophila]
MPCPVLGERKVNYSSTEENIQMALFCDASRAIDSDLGGIAVTYKPWLPDVLRPTERRRTTTKAAYPIHPLNDHRLGELMAVCEALLIAHSEISNARRMPELVGKVVHIRIFNDRKFNLEYLNGERATPWPRGWIAGDGDTALSPSRLCTPKVLATAAAPVIEDGNAGTTKQEGGGSSHSDDEASITGNESDVVDNNSLQKPTVTRPERAEEAIRRHRKETSEHPEATSSSSLRMPESQSSSNIPYQSATSEPALGAVEVAEGVEMTKGSEIDRAEPLVKMDGAGSQGHSNITVAQVAESGVADASSEADGQLQEMG